MEFLRHYLGLILRTLVSVLLIAWLIQWVDWSRLWLIVRTMNAGWLIAALFCSAFALPLVAWRWRMLLSVHGVRLGFWRIFELTMIGQFFSAFMVGTTGGDMVKIFYVARTVPQSKAAVSFTVIVDRFIGLVALLVLGVALSVTQLDRLLSKPGTRAATLVFYLFALGGVAASLLACLGPLLPHHQALRSFINRLPFIHLGTPLFAAYEQTARAFEINFLAFTGSIIAHLGLLLRGYCIILSMHLEPPFLLFSSIIIIVALLIAMPVSISGIGVRETLFILFFALLAIDKEQAISFSVTFFGINILWSLLGGLIYFLYRHETHTPAPNVAEAGPIFPD